MVVVSCLLHLHDKTSPHLVPAKEVKAYAFLSRDIRSELVIAVFQVVDDPFSVEDDVDDTDEEFFVVGVSKDRLEASVGQYLGIAFICLVYLFHILRILRLQVSNNYPFKNLNVYLCTIL